KGRDFHRRVRLGYLDQAQQDPKRYVVVDAGQGPDAVFEELWRKTGVHLLAGQVNSKS
ncbi:MAG: dTMP kinase, partial [Phycisphaerales bacterium]|nr:dTMP kinase [Phycisphaerales bacterium]